MSRRLLIAVVPILLAAAAGQTPDAAAQTTSALKACLARDVGGGDALRAHLTKCQRAELRRQDARLNKAYRDVMADPSKLGGIQPNADVAGLRKGLRAAQRAWLRFRDAECAWMGNTYVRGVEAELTEVTCLGRLTRLRADQLRALADHIASVSGRK